MDLAPGHRPDCDTLPDLRSAPEPVAEEADQVLAGAELLHLAPAAAPADRARCTHGGAAGFRLPTGTTLVRFPGPGPTKVTLRRFASAYTAEVGTAQPGRYYALRIPRDAATDPWFAHASPSGSVTACRA